MSLAVPHIWDMMYGDLRKVLGLGGGRILRARPREDG